MIPLSFTHRSLPTIFRLFPPHSVRISQLFVYRLRALMPFQSTPAHSQSISTVPVPPSILCSFPVISLLIPHRFPVNSMLIFHRFPAHSQSFPVQVPPSIPTHSLSFLCSFTVISLLIPCHFSAHFLSFICSFTVISLLISCLFSARFLSFLCSFPVMHFSAHFLSFIC